VSNFNNANAAPESVICTSVNLCKCQDLSDNVEFLLVAIMLGGQTRKRTGPTIVLADSQEIRDLLEG
jgi:hypothetical protein